MRVVQFSTSYCQPCQMAKHFINELQPKEGTYEYVDLGINSNMEKWRPLIIEKQIKTVPYFIVYDGEEIKETFQGFSRNKSKLTEILKP